MTGRQNFVIIISTQIHDSLLDLDWIEHRNLFHVFDRWGHLHQDAADDLIAVHNLPICSQDNNGVNVRYSSRMRTNRRLIGKAKR